MDNMVTLISLNVRGIREKVKRKNIFEWCKVKGGDIIFLQETYSTYEVEKTWETEWGGAMFFSHGTNHSRGTLVLISPNIKLKVNRVDIDQEGRFVLLNAETQGAKLLLGNVYFPTRDKEKIRFEFLEKLDRAISQLVTPDCSLVLGGDFNIIMDGKLDHMGQKTVSKSKFNDTFKDFLSSYLLEDIWRKRNPSERQFTFRQKWPVIQSRLDYWFASSSLVKLVNKCEILSSIAPDHSGISLTFKQLVDTFKYGRSYWKFNNSLCEDKLFVDTMKERIRELKEKFTTQFSNKSLLWDFMKMKMREFAIDFSRKNAKIRRLEIQKLETEINDLENRLLIAPSKEISEEIDDKKSLLNKLYEYSRQGVRVRSRAEWCEEGEHNIQYFEQLLKANKRKSVIRELYNEENVITDKKQEILKLIKTFYGNLYSKKKKKNSKLLFFKDIVKLSEESRNLCEGKVTKEECFNVLQQMKHNKSPGNDGLTVEYYCTFWPLLGDLLVEVLNESHDRGELSNSQKQGVITLLEKKGKDTLYVKNYRPITLLNVDYKILSKVLANRIKEVLGEIIHHDQVGYIKDRNIGEAVRLIDDMFFYSQNQTNGFLVAVDFEKAFDSVDHEFLFHVLELFGFGCSFCSWVKVLYTNITSCVMNGGDSTGYFDIKQGVRQGDPLSPYLFLLAMEILAHRVRQDDTIIGFKFGDYEIKQILYADDVTLFVKDVNSVNRLKLVFEEFEKVSGLKVNEGKTNFIWMGKDMENPNVPIFGNFVNEIKILGVHFTFDIKKKDDLNYKEILSKIKRLLGWWKERDLSITGKVHLLKTYALSKLNYVSSLIVVPGWVISEVDKISFEFLWKGKDRIKRNILYQNYEFGGLRMNNYKLFIKTQRIMWLKRLIYGEKEIGWKMFFDHCSRKVGGRFIVLCDYEISKLKTDLPLFYIEVLKAWYDIRKCRYSDTESINPIIFNNKNICLKGDNFFHRSLYEKEVYALDHIIYKGRMRSLEYFLRIGVNSKELLIINDIYNAIPEIWKGSSFSDKFQQVDIKTFNINLTIFEQKIAFRDVQSRKIYAYLIKDLQTLYTLKINDGQTNISLSEEEIKETFTRPRSSTLIRKQRDFQFKLLHGSVYTREQLFKFGFVPNNLCSFCTQEVETYLHVFVECPNVKKIWQTMVNHFKLEEIKEIKSRDIFLGLPGNSVRIKFVNSLIIMVKYILYNSRKEGSVPSFVKITKYIQEYIQVEKNLASKRGSLGVHLLKWEYF